MNYDAIGSAIFDSPSRDFDVELWDGFTMPPPKHGTGAGRVVLRSRNALAQLAPPVDERRVAEAFVKGEVDIVGDTIAVLAAVAQWDGPRRPLAALPWAAAAWARSIASAAHRKLSAIGRHSIERDGRSVRRHYDLSDDFYALFLDRLLVYSCAYFSRGDESIDEAQQAKLELICRKLGLKEGDHLLDIGCGWGALLFHAAERFRVKATGTTISGNQLSEVRRRAMTSLAEPRVVVLDSDYRQLPNDFVDKISSVGMMEHVGAARLDDYFGQLYRRLKPGGLVLNHAIAEISSSKRTVPWLQRASGAFIQRDIFPDSELPALRTVIAAAERQGFEVRDVESLREHYEQTLRHWLRRLEARFEDAVMLVGMRTARAWRLYLAASAVSFRLGHIGIYQTLLAKRGAEGRIFSGPSSRAIWYRDEGDSEAET